MGDAETYEHFWPALHENIGILAGVLVTGTPVTRDSTYPVLSGLYCTCKRPARATQPCSNQQGSPSKMTLSRSCVAGLSSQTSDRNTIRSSSAAATCAANCSASSADALLPPKKSSPCRYINLSEPLYATCPCLANSLCCRYTSCSDALGMLLILDICLDVLAKWQHDYSPEPCQCDVIAQSLATMQGASEVRRLLH